MQGQNDWKGLLKEMFKQALRGNVGTSVNRAFEAMYQNIEKAVDQVASNTIDETKIEEVVQSARAGATYTAVTYAVERIVKDSFEAATPILLEISEGVTSGIFQAFREGLTELITEEVQKKTQGQSPTP